MAKQDRVKLRIYVGDAQATYQLITSREKADEFFEAWSSTFARISIIGTIDHCDGNRIELSFIREEIKAVEVLEIMSL